MVKKLFFNKKNIMLISIILIIIAILSFIIGYNNIALAEINNSLDIHIKGEFIDGDREYGSYFASFYVNKLNATDYKVKLDITLTTKDWKSDQYFYQTFGYYFFGNNVKIKSASERIEKLDINTSYGAFDKSKLEMNQKGIGGCFIDFSKSKDSKGKSLARHNNYPVIREEFVIQVIGDYPNLGFAFSSMDLMGVFLAKDTRISNQDFVRFDINTLDFSNVGVSYKYMPKYKNMTLIQNAVFTSLGGPVPENWTAWGVL